MPRRVVKKVRASKVLLITISICAVLAVLGMGTLGVSVYLKAQTESRTREETCEAVRRNNDILRDLLVHVEHRSLISIKEGVTKDITAAQVRSFYDPTLRRIDAVQC